MNALHKIRFLIYVLFLRLRRWKRVIVLERTEGLGDVLCCLPLYRALKRKHPGHLVLFATARPYAALLRCCGEIDTVYGIPPFATIPKQKAAWLVERHFEPHNSGERGQGGQKMHLAHEFLIDCGLPTEDWQPRIAVPEGKRAAAARRFGFPQEDTLIAIHTGRTWPVKELPEDCWQEIVDGLQKKRPCRIVHFCSPARHLKEALPIHKFQGVQAMPPDLPLLVTAAILSQCRLLIGVDSGLLHLAGALGIPVIGIFGPTNPNYFLPFTAMARGIFQTLPCSFCQHEAPIKHWLTGCPHNVRCMKEIPAAEVVKVADGILAQGPAPDET